MGETVHEVAAGLAATAEAPPRGRGRPWPRAVAVTCLVGLPIGALLCYAALLPFFIGLFYFMLFGLLLGAVLYRVGQRGRPMSKRTVMAGVAVVVAVIWATSLLTEAYDFPGQVAAYSYEKIRRLPEGMTPDDFLRESGREVARHLAEQYAPGGVLGYVRWAATSSRIDPPVAHLRRPFVANQKRWWWVLRVVLSVVLLSYGVHTQVAPLTRLPDADNRAGAAGNPPGRM